MIETKVLLYLLRFSFIVFNHKINKAFIIPYLIKGFLLDICKFKDFI